MATKAERLQQIWHEYEREQGHAPTRVSDAVKWAVRKGFLELPALDPYDALASQMASALREETAVDSTGRRYRVNHAVRISKGGVQYTLWATMGYAPPEHMQKTFAQRREQIIGDCVHLKADVDAYNAMSGVAHPDFQLVLDFTDDVAEREFVKAA